MWKTTSSTSNISGDTVSIQLVPEDVAEETYYRGSPRYVNTYRKSFEPIFVLSHEALNGGAVSTEVTPEDPSELTSPTLFYTDYVQLLKDVEVEKKFPIGKPIVYTGKIGSVDYKSKITTYGRLRVSKIVNADIDHIGIFTKPFERLSAKSAAKLSLYLSQFPDGVEKLRDLQKYFLQVVTKAGVITFDYKTLFSDSNTETYTRICDIADSKDFTDKQKLLLMTEEYKKYEKEMAATFSDELKDELSKANRVKITSLVGMTMPQLIVSGVDEKPVITRGTLLQGYSEKDFQFHSIENRSLQSIKQSGVKQCALELVAHYKS